MLNQGSELALRVLYKLLPERFLHGLEGLCVEHTRKCVLSPRRRGPEAQKAHERRLREGFYERYMRGHGLDIGHSGGQGRFQSVLASAIGVDLDYPGYKNGRLPFSDGSKDFVHSSHCLEHCADPVAALKEWFRVLKVGGFLVITVPHQHLYEKRRSLPSIFNGDHKMFFTPARLLHYVEQAFEVNTYRVRLLRDCDEGFNYALPPEEHSWGEYEIELIVEKLEKPHWDLV